MSPTTFVPMRLARRGPRRPLVDTNQRQASPALLRALGLALFWQSQLDQGIYVSLHELAAREGLHLSTVGYTLQLALMAPDLIERCLAGQQPRTLRLQWLMRHRLPNDWDAQRQIFAAFS